MALTRRSRDAVYSLRRDLAGPALHLDWSIVALSVLLVAIGIATIFSTTKGSGPTPDTSYVTRQVVALLLGLGLMIGLAILDYRRLREFVPLLYGGSLLLLVAVLVVGSELRGAQAWFAVGPFTLQPSEPSKFAFIVTLAAYLSIHRDDLTLRRLAIVLTVAGLPMGLILLQPDLGTMLVFAVITFTMLAVAGLPLRYLGGLVVAAAIGTSIVLGSGLLAEYQRDRLLVFIDTSADMSLDQSYNVEQSQTAISLGGVTGWGWGNGPQTQDGMVPEQETDFIFTAVGEELGFVGAATLLALFLALCLRITRAAQLARDDFGTLLCSGVLAMFAFQIFENVGMTMRIMPVTGIPLPFVSYGGSSLLTTLASVGVVLSVHMHRFR
ncbi:MAG: rod shape-determining protein RodA [Actinobacteria bacterium]|nr:rod shape-determining protein RodA [Actinomycetota bacterium]